MVGGRPGSRPLRAPLAARLGCREGRRGARLALLEAAGALLRAGVAPAFCLPCTCTPCPVLHTYPTDPPPCDAASTLQACIDGAASGDAILLETNGPIAESLTIAKSLTLAAAGGFSPFFSGSQSITADFAGADTHVLEIDGLWFQAGRIHVTQDSEGQLTVRVLGNRFDSSSIAAPEIAVDHGLSGGGPVTFDLSGNTMTVPSGTVARGIYVQVQTLSSASGREPPQPRLREPRRLLRGRSGDGDGRSAVRRCGRLPLAARISRDRRWRPGRCPPT